MRISSATIGMESARRYTSSVKKISHIKTMNVEGSDNRALQFNQASLEDLQGRMSKVVNKGVSLQREENTVENFRQLSLRYIFNLLFGREKAKFFQSPIQEFNTNQYLITHQSVSFYESEYMAFKANGTVKTADGREITLHINVEMSREFSAYYEENFGFAKLNTCDPLVVNLQGDIARLSEETFYFDLDADGEKEEIAQLQQGNGYLALDKNGDGKVNDGQELFGAQSGNGFEELSVYDEDKNGWIDENDHVWSKLKIWCKDEMGQDKLYSLTECGIGAICLQNANTEFTLGDPERTSGYIRKTGIFLYENKGAGIIQHLDLVQKNNFA